MKTYFQLPHRVAALCCATLLVASLSAQTEALPNSPTPADPMDPSATPVRRADVSATANNNLSHADRTFFEKAAKSGMKEVTVSQAVQAKLMRADSREFAQMMVTDHTMANNELMALAARKGVMLPADEAKDAQKWSEKWSKNNKDVDDEYLSTMVDDHQEAVKLFEKASKSDDPDIAAFAQKMLPKLQQHLDHVKMLKKMDK